MSMEERSDNIGEDAEWSWDESGSDDPALSSSSDSNLSSEEAFSGLQHCIDVENDPEYGLGEPSIFTHKAKRANLKQQTLGIR